MARGQVVVLPDAELVLPGEKLPKFDTIQVVSHLFGGMYPSVQAMIRARSKVEYVLGQQVTETQRDLCVPGCWAYFEIADAFREPNEHGSTRLTVFGEVPDIDDLERSERASGCDDAHARLLRKRIVNAHNRGWLFGRWYSVVTGDNGEWGAVHISTLEPLTHESFLEARARGWTAL